MIRKLFNQCLGCLVGLLDCIEVAIDLLRTLIMHHLCYYVKLIAMRGISCVKYLNQAPSLGLMSETKINLAGAQFHRSEIFTLFLAGANALRLLAHKNV